MSLSKAPGDGSRVDVWLRIREPLERQLAPLGQATMAALSIARGERVLDIGCGVGGTPRALASAVGPQGEVVALDLLPEAVEVARQGQPANVNFLCGDAEVFPFDDAPFDAVFSRFGMMFFANPAAAFGNIRRAMKPGGRLGFVCWRDLAENELDALPLRAAAPHLPQDVVEGTGEARFLSFSDPAVIGEVLRQAGFAEAKVAPHDAVVRCGDLKSTVEVCSSVGAAGAILRKHPQFREAAAKAIEDALRPLDGPGGPGLRAATWIVTAWAGG